MGLSFDADLIQANFVTKGDDIWDFFQGGTIDNSDGEISGIGEAILDGKVSKPIYLCIISFTAKRTSGNAYLDFNNLIVTDACGCPILDEYLIVNNGKVTIKKEDTLIHHKNQKYNQKMKKTK